MPRESRRSEISLAEAAELVGGEFKGDGSLKITGVCSLDEQRAGCIAFCDKTNPKALEEITSSLTVAALILKDDVEVSELPDSLNYIVVANPLRAMTILITELHEFWLPSQTISDKADIHPSAKIGENVTIAAFSVVGEGCRIDDGVVIYPHVVIYPGCHIGAGSVVHSGAMIREDTVVGKGAVVQNGAIIGADGFGYFPDEKGLQAVPQVGNTILADGAEIGANSCVDRATLGSTVIGPNSKIDNLVQVGHNTKIGHNSIVCGHSGISGSCTIGNQVTIAGGVGIGDHTTIDDGATFAARSGLGYIKRYKKGTYAGNPAIPVTRWRRQALLLDRLPEFVKEVNKHLRAGKTAE